MLKNIIDLIFGSALFFNALIFIPQAIKIWKEKTAKGVSLWTFFGFLITQFFIVLHGIIHKDYILAAGYFFAMFTCGAVVFLVLIYGRNKPETLPKSFDSDRLEMLEKIIAAMPENFYWMNKEGFYLGCNDNQAKSIGLDSRKDIIGKRNVDLPGFLIPEVLDPVNKKIMTEGKAISLEEPALLRDGTKAIFISSKVPTYDDRGEISGMVGISVDITKAKQKIADQLEILNKIIALMPGHVYWIDKKGCYLGCNDQQAISAGLTSREEIIGKRNKDLPWNSNATLLPEALDKINDEVMKTGNAVTAEEPGTLIDGTKKVFLSNKVPLLTNEGHVIGMVGISIDITEKKQAQEALKQANRARLEFIYTASHEVRGPVSSAISMTERLREHLETLESIVPQRMTHSKEAEPISQMLTETLEYCQDIQSESERALASLKNLTDLHRMQLEGIVTRPGLCSVQQFLALAVQKSTYPNTNNVQIEQFIHPDVPQKIIMDNSNMMTALSIIIGNAFRFSHPHGKINITVKKAPKDEDKWVIISVQDFGVGMYQEQIDRLSLTPIDPKNKQESLYAKPSVQLLRVKMYLEASGGRLAIESTLKEGTEVQLTIPYQLPAPKNKTEEKIIRLETWENNDTERLVFHTVHQPICSVLLIEDDTTTQKITSQRLIELGYQVDIAKSGAEAIQMAEANEYTIVLLDITLPDINGLDVMRQIRESKGEEIIFIALSSHSSEEEEDYFMRQGAMSLLAKPVTSEKLKNALDDALETKARLEREG
jgi:two-component system aerobic respiration control sensor histidine kinase ArcB